MGLELLLNLSLEDFPGWWGGGGEKLGIKLKLSFSWGLGLAELGKKTGGKKEMNNENSGHYVIARTLTDWNATLVAIEQRQRKRDKDRETETKRLRQRLRCQRVEFQIDQLLTNSMTE